MEEVFNEYDKYDSIDSSGKNVSQAVIERIMEMIMNGDLKEGDRLPPERELTEMLGVGRPALRESLRALEFLGLVESRHGSGNYIVNNVATNYFKPLSLSFKLHGGSSKEVLEFRNCLEQFAVSQAAAVATPDDVAVLKCLLDDMESAESTQEKADIDLQIHTKVAAIAGNPLICDALQGVSILMNSLVTQSIRLSYYEGDSIENIYREHGQTHSYHRLQLDGRRLPVDGLQDSRLQRACANNQHVTLRVPAADFFTLNESAAFVAAFTACDLSPVLIELYASISK